ncbi:hypothetical protein [Deinococcus hopiensis]|uniref:Uncharacterized protein n=1 Tax=Deinococcus hopiensis KR-140 TaxID=695939 RepID=A0A1W1V8B2_9DEIO|nr:hypothetical protein [Deinococcus hopiensis]SMB89430.1 hypothetical protein SAMN00790413_00412 [Deinococcus hopiensis KR-140]
MSCLEERDVDTDALRLTPCGEDWAQETRLEHTDGLPLHRGTLSCSATFEERVGSLVAVLSASAVVAHLEANSPKVLAHRKQREGAT